MPPVSPAPAAWTPVSPAAPGVRYAGFWIRAGAYVIDGIIIGVAQGLLFALLFGGSILNLIGRGINGDVGPDMMFDAVPTMAEHVRGGRVKALATTGLSRSSVMPDVPTVAESGIPGYEQTTWNGLLATAKTPPAIIQLLNENLRAGLKTTQTQERFAAVGLETGGMSPAEFSAMIKGEITRWTKVIRDAGIKAE